MKKLGKLSINLNKVMKNEELVNLRGGQYEYGYSACCMCKDADKNFLGFIVGTAGPYDCYLDCRKSLDRTDVVGVYYC